MITDICWKKEILTAEDLSGRRPYLLRYHEREDGIPGPVRGSGIIVQSDIDEYALVMGFHGAIDKTDRGLMKDFCRDHGFKGAFWWRCKEGREPYQGWLFKD